VHNSTDRVLLGAAVCGLAAALAGCAAGSKLNTIPQDGLTMEQIYRRHMGTARVRDMQEARSAIGHAGGSEAALFRRYQEASVQDTEVRFERLPNPDLVMYVAPHLSPNGRYPIPGYSTVFPLYESVEYAMPGEAPWRRTAAPPPRPAPSPSAAAATLPTGGSTAPLRKPTRHGAED
jgi:conjugative transfer region lipoprotein (TIGR03751 family)